jgi:hypothetical protein
MSYDQTIIAEAAAVAQQARQDFLDLHGGQGGVVLSAIAGAGKSYFVSETVGVAREGEMRVAVAAPTNEQAFGLVTSIARLNPSIKVTYVPANGIDLPAANMRANVITARPAHAAARAEVVVGTMDKLSDAFIREDLPEFDGLLIDESYQADSARYYAAAGIAPVHLAVGDGGQIEPFSTVQAAERWRGLEENPLQTAVGVLCRNHPDTPVHRFPITRRLDPRAVPVIRCFYPPEHRFRAAVLPGVRGMRLQDAVAPTDRLRHIDTALDLAATDGWAHLELPDAAVLTCDPDTIAAIIDCVSRLRHRAAQLRSEHNHDWHDLTPQRIAVGVSHNDQKDLLRGELDRAGLGDVVVNTANKLQGLEYDVVICWHPLAGLPEADGFHLEPGRAAVLLTRHRHACIVVGREGDRDLVEGVSPATPAFLGCDSDPVLDGWSVHQDVFEALEPFRVAL